MPMRLSITHKTGLCAFVALGLIFTSCGCGQKSNESRSDRIKVAVSIGPLSSFAKAIGGDLVEVQVLVPPGASPHTYQLNPDQMKFLSDASVLVLNGLNLEFWADKAVSAVDNPKLIVVRAADGLPVIRDSDPHAHEDSGNPHVWLDPVSAIYEVESIRDAFIKADPKHKSEYKARTEAYTAKLVELDKNVRKRVSNFRYKHFVAFHPAWVYYAKRYGLVEAAVIEQSPGKDPSPADLRNVIDTVRRLKARAIFAEPQLSAKAAEVVAGETGAKVVMINPQGTPPSYDYIELINNATDQMEKALK